MSADSVLVVKKSDLEIALGEYAEEAFFHMYEDCGCVLFAPPNSDTAYICVNVGQLGAILVWQFPTSLLVYPPTRVVSCGYTSLVTMGIAGKIEDPLAFELYVNTLSIGMEKRAEQNRAKAVALGLASMLPFALETEALEVEIVRTKKETNFRITFSNITDGEFENMVKQLGVQFVVRYCTQFSKLLFPNLVLIPTIALPEKNGNPSFYGTVVTSQRANELRIQEARAAAELKTQLKQNPSTPLSLKKWLDDDPRSKPQ